MLQAVTLALGIDPTRLHLAEATRLQARMIVVGNRQVQGASRVLGSIAADVTRRADYDVLLANVRNGY